MANASLFDTVTTYCHRQYSSTQCCGCNHSVGCPGSPCGNCKQCLKEVHYPTQYPSGKKDYDCLRMMYFYVCDYTEKYASEMLYLMRKSSSLKIINDYHVLSIGCGACPDLIAIEKYCQDESSSKTISYFGIDSNPFWSNIHNEISSYRSATISKTQFQYFDAVSSDFCVNDANVIILQYIISHFYNNGQISQIHAFFQKLVNSIVTHKQQGIPMVILINDVNSLYRGRDYFVSLVEQLKTSGFHGTCAKYYFDYNLSSSFQEYGNKQESQQTLFCSPCEFESIYQPWHNCSSAQLLIEVQ